MVCLVGRDATAVHVVWICPLSRAAGLRLGAGRCVPARADLWAHIPRNSPSPMCNDMVHLHARSRLQRPPRWPLPHDPQPLDNRVNKGSKRTVLCRSVSRTTSVQFA
eukprot:703827-Prymnesium_polylepis.1